MIIKFGSGSPRRNRSLLDARNESDNNGLSIRLRKAFQKAEKERFWHVINQIQDRQKEEDPDETLRFVTEVVEEVRQERYDGMRQT